MDNILCMQRNDRYGLTIPECKVLVLRRDPCSRLGLCSILSEQKNLTVKDQTDLNNAVTAFGDFNPDVIIVDYQSFVHSNFKLHEHIQSYFSNAKLLISCKEISRDIVLRVYAASAGLYYDDGDINKMLLAIVSTYSGSVYVDPISTAFLSGNLLFPRETYAWNDLLPCELTAIKELILGKEYLEIGQLMNVSRATVGNYIGSAVKKFGLKNRTQLIVAAIHSGLLNEPA